jgi:hypothetical protein
MRYKGKTSRALLLPKKRDGFVAIKRFLMDGDVVLKVEEEAILNRWIYADALMRAKEMNEEQMIRDIAEKFDISVHTSRGDIQNAQRLFADARKVNKKYLIHHHLQRIDEDIQKIRKKLFRGDGDTSKIPDSKEMAALAKLFETYTYTLNSIPDEEAADKQPPPVFIFKLAPGQTIEAPLEIDDAVSMADEILMKQGEDGVYEMEEEQDAE